MSSGTSFSPARIQSQQLMFFRVKMELTSNAISSCRAKQKASSSAASLIRFFASSGRQTVASAFWNATQMIDQKPVQELTHFDDLTGTGLQVRQRGPIQVQQTRQQLARARGNAGVRKARCETEFVQQFHFERENRQGRN